MAPKAGAVEYQHPAQDSSSESWLWYWVAELLARLRGKTVNFYSLLIIDSFSSQMCADWPGQTLLVSGVQVVTDPSAPITSECCTTQLFHWSFPLAAGMLWSEGMSGQHLESRRAGTEPKPCPLLQVWLCHVAPRGGEDQGGSNGELFPQWNL